MAYLYGDSSASKLEVNYIELLRDALEFSVEVLLAIHKIRTWEASKRERQLAANNDVTLLGELERGLGRVLEKLSSGQQTTPTGRCSASIGRAVASSVATEVSSVRQALADDLARIDVEIGRERTACVRALEALLLRHDLPETSRGVHVQLTDGGGYDARLLEAALHLEAVIALEIPDGHMFSAPLRVEKLQPNMEIRAPDKRGWLHKRVKMVTQKLAKKLVVEILRGTAETTIKLRATPDLGDSGFDLVVDADERVTMLRVGKEASGAAPFEPEGADRDKLLDLYYSLTEGVTSLIESRTQLLDARLDDKPLDEHDNPAILVRRLVTSMSPVVRKIAGHSLQDDELVLKRVLSDDRREEIFISRADLDRKLERLPPEMRSLFAPLGLGTTPVAGDDVPTPEQQDDEETTAVQPPSTELRRLATADLEELSEDDDSEDVLVDPEWLEEDSSVAQEGPS